MKSVQLATTVLLASFCPMPCKRNVLSDFQRELTRRWGTASCVRDRPRPRRPWGVYGIASSSGDKAAEAVKATRWGRQVRTTGPRSQGRCQRLGADYFGGKAMLASSSCIDLAQRASLSETRAVMHRRSQHPVAMRL